MLTRREFTAGASALLLTSLLMPLARGRAFAQTPGTLEAKFAEIEAETGGRLGVAVIGTGSDLRATHRGDERFPLCSTFKLLAAAAILSRVDQGKERLDRRIDIQPQALVDYSPETGKHVGDQMSLAAVCKAAVTLSDNTAGNLMLEALGGPEALTAYIRSLGDTETRLDRVEPELNSAEAGDPRDTTTPSAMAADLETLLVGEALTPASRDQLIAWLAANKTGDERLRAGLPEDWRVGDKTGSCNATTANDAAIVWPPERPPILIAAYLTGATVPREKQNAALAAVAEAVAGAIF